MPEQDPVSAHVVAVVVGVEDGRQPNTCAFQVLKHRSCIARIHSSRFLRCIVEQKEDVVVG
jgi:hypothetical protein